MSIVMQINPYEFFADTQGGALDAGYIWIGQPNLDPRQYPITVYYDEALTIPAAMPLRTSNGYVVRNGSPTFLYVNGNYSVRVEDSRHRQVFYVPDFLLIGTGQAVTFADLSNTSDPTKGDALLGVKQTLPGGVARTQHDRNEELYYVTDWGAKTTNLDNTAFFQAAATAVKNAGGGTIRIPKGTWIATNVPLMTGVYWEGDGEGATIITQNVGQNSDIFITEGFATFTGVGPLQSAPLSFGISKLTVDGNYLQDPMGSSIGGDTIINNTAGYGVRIFGSKYSVTCEIINCAQVGFYSEAVDYTGYKEEQNSYVRIAGRVFGKEAVVYRGPADCNLEHVLMGCPGWLPTNAARNSTLVMSDLYPGENTHVMVSDEETVYNGHHEFGFMHLYGNLSGLGYKTMNTGRLKGNHMVVENCRGGAYFGSRVWGEISILEAHANGREPSTLAGTLPVFPDIEIASLQSFTVHATVRRNQSQAASYIGLKSTGRGTVVKLNYYAIGTIPTNSKVAEITSDSCDYDIACQFMLGDAVTIEGTCNRVNVNGRTLTGGALVRRIAGASNQNLGNVIDIVARDVASCLYVDGLVTSESLKISALLNAGQTITTGSTLDLFNRSLSVSFNAHIAGVVYSSTDVGRIVLDNTTTAEQTIDVPHTYFQIPDASQVSFSLYDPAPSYAGAMQYIYLRATTATTLTFVYKLSATGANGPLILCFQISGG